MLHWLIMVLLQSQFIVSIWSICKSRTFCWSMSYIIQNQLYPMTQKHHKHESFQVSLVTNPLLSSWELKQKTVQQISFVSPLRTRCSKWINQVTVKHFSEERFAGYLGHPPGDCMGISAVVLIFYIALLSIVI